MSVDWTKPIVTNLGLPAKVNAELLAAAKALVANWDDKRGEPRERYVPPRDENDELGGYWSPESSMVDSARISHLREAIARAEQGLPPAPRDDGKAELIVAAYDASAALNDLTWALDDEERAQPSNKAALEALDALNAAIARAEGRAND